MSQIRTWKHSLLLGISILSWAFSPAVSSAQVLPCGNIIGPESIYIFDGDFENIVTKPIDNCEDPFNVTLEPASPYTLKIDGVDIDNGEIYIQNDPIQSIDIEGTGEFNYIESFLFKHAGNDYVFINQQAPTPTIDDYREFASTYFVTEEETEHYIAILIEEYETGNIDQYFFDEFGELLIDENTNDTIAQRYNDFKFAADSHFSENTVTYEPGVYTVLIKESLLIYTQDSFWKKLQKFFINTAHAESDLGPHFYTITFTVAAESAGASSVLFLPGIMGSRLYEESAVCNLYGGADKVERWFSTFDCDIERLIMNENGHSVYPLFTETDDSVIEEVFGGNLYKSFISDLRDWKESGQISDYRAVPYDWRLGLHDVLKTTSIDGRISPNSSVTYRDGYIYQSLVALSEASPEGKVVLVGHSNGGLVIQTLLATMKANNDPLLDAIDKVILVAVPQVGTPESVVGMLHGVDIGIAGVAVSDEQSRKLINTAPFGYHLLPSAGYYDKVATPVITIEAGTSTNQWISQFGNKLDSLEEVTTFLTKESGRSTPNWENTSMPATAYSELLHYADNAHNFISDWKSVGTLVYEIAGTGINTPVTINYFSDFACLRSEIITGGVTHCLEYGTKLGYRVSEVIDGDGTVVTPSALATRVGEGVEKWWLDLKKYKSPFRVNRIHKDIFEVPEISEFISDIISSNTLESYTYLATSSPEFPDEDRLLLRLHSPLDLHIILEDGEVVGSSTPIIRGVEYRRYGEVQQLSVPDNEQNYQIRLSGVATGSFTLDMEEYSGNNLNNRTTYSAIPSSTSTEVILSIEDMDSLEELYLQIDYEGDGVFEAMALPGISQIFTNTTITPDTIDKRSTSGTKVKNRILTSVPESELVVGTINVSERELMLQLIDLLTRYRDLLIKNKAKI